MYKFIGNEDDIRKFYKLHLQQFTDQDYLTFIIIPIARRKYWQELSCSQFSINTKLFSSKKDENMFVREIKKYQIEEGLYVDGETPIPASAMALYITADPMNEIQAYFSFQQKVGQRIEKIICKKETKNNKDNDPPMNMVSIYKSCLHTSPEKTFRKLDVDTKEHHLILKLRATLDELGIRPHLVVESRSGYHVVLHNERSFEPATPIDNHQDNKDNQNNQNNKDNKDKNNKDNMNKSLYAFAQANKDWVTIENNPLIVIPGTYQGGFLTKLVDW